MTDERLQEIRKRANAATPGPWATGAGTVEGGQLLDGILGPLKDATVSEYGGDFLRKLNLR